MKITAIKTFLGSFGNRSRGLIKVETDEGLYGWGEAYSVGPDRSVEPIADYIFEMIKGEDPRRIEYIMLKLMQQFRFPSGGAQVWPLFPVLTMPSGTLAERPPVCRFICCWAALCVIGFGCIRVWGEATGRKRQNGRMS
jgi:hypothetical protein